MRPEKHAFIVALIDAMNEAGLEASEGTRDLGKMHRQKEKQDQNRHRGGKMGNELKQQSWGRA